MPPTPWVFKARLFWNGAAALLLLISRRRNGIDDDVRILKFDVHFLLRDMLSLSNLVDVSPSPSRPLHLTQHFFSLKGRNVRNGSRVAWLYFNLLVGRQLSLLSGFVSFFFGPLKIARDQLIFFVVVVSCYCRKTLDSDMTSTPPHSPFS